MPCEKAAQEFYGVDILPSHLHFCKGASGIYSLHLNLCLCKDQNFVLSWSSHL